MLIGINISTFQDITDDKDFFTKLLCEESISCLPASVKHFFIFLNPPTSNLFSIGIRYR